MSTHDKMLEARRSCQLKSNSKNASNRWKSDVCINSNKGSYTIFKTATGSDITDVRQKHKEYYKRYEHDEVPVKDNANNVRKRETSAVEIGDNEKSITNSHLDRLEQNIFKDMSQEIKLDHNSVGSLDNMKFLKETVQEIFSNFHSNMRDFDVYKKKLTEILTKTEIDYMVEMETFIKEIIENIVLSESSIQSPMTNDIVQVEVQDGGVDTMQDSKTESSDSNGTFEHTTGDESVHFVVEAYKNDNYLTDSTFNDNSKSKNHTFMDNRVNVYLLSNTPCVIKMNNRSLLSEINIKDSSTEVAYVASTENMKKMAAKKIEIERYKLQPQQMFDREIPVKVSFANKNLCSGDDGTPQDKEIEESSKSFMAKICSFICKKFRRNALG